MKSRQIILSKLQKNTHKDFDNTLINTPSPFPAVQGSLLDAFSEKLTSLHGEVYFFHSVGEAITKLKEDSAPFMCHEPFLQSILNEYGISYITLEEDCTKVNAGITSCESLVAQTGSIIVSTAHSPSKMFAYPPVHIIWAYQEQLVESMNIGLKKLREKYTHVPARISFITGPSRTADIEKTLVLGAHGPVTLKVFILEHPES